jgi:subtilisin family serine protease
MIRFQYRTITRAAITCGTLLPILTPAVHARQQLRLTQFGASQFEGRWTHTPDNAEAHATSKEIGHGTELRAIAKSVSDDPALDPPAQVIAWEEAGVHHLAFSTGEVFHKTTSPILNLRTVAVPGLPTVLVLWDEVRGGSPADGLTVPHYAISIDGRTLAGRVREVSYNIGLRYARFDPLKGTPGVNRALRADAANNLYLVQFWTVPLEAFRTQINRLGGEVVRFVPGNTHIVRMNAAVAEQVRQLPYVRWVGPNHIAYKLDDAILSGLIAGMPEGLATYSIEVFDRGRAQQDAVASRINALGGRVVNTNPDGFRMTAWLNPSQILPIARMNEVHFMDPWGPGEADFETARLISGAIPTLSNAGITGQGVRGEVFDTGIEPHADFANPDPIFHHGSGGGGHGTSVYGIVFGSGRGNPRATGFLPDREQGISALFTQSSQFGGPISRHQHTAELVDPNDQWRAVFQTSSVGGPRTRQYTTVSAETDDYLFISQLLSTQANGNSNLIPEGRPQSWAKNIVTVGGVRHNSTLTRTDDSSIGSIGPAPDGRIKPDLVHFYDNILATSGTSGYASFGGTSGSTPIVAGCFGLLFQMWHEGVFPGHGGGASVFDSRAKMATAKAMMINTAFRYDWYTPGVPTPNTNMWRDRQGWGMPHVGAMYTMRDKFMIIDETDIILPLQTNRHEFRVEPGEPALSVTMVYADPKGTPGAAVHRINDLSLRVTSPGGISYWGNNGLRDTNWSTPGGSSNTVDTVENVFIKNPTPGVWLIEVIADEIVEDGHVETAALDADYALVASGGTALCYPDCDTSTGVGTLDIFDFLCFQNLFVNANPYACDCDTSTGPLVCDIFDFLCFQNAFANGCP